MSNPTDTTTRKASTEVVTHLNQIVAESYALMAQLHLVHWNVEGENFFQLHEAYQAQYEELFTAIDDLAERVRALGFHAEGGLSNLAARASVEEGPSGVSFSGKDSVASAIVGHETVAAACYEGRIKAAEAGDAETEDIMIARIQVHQKAVWMLKSYLK